MRKNCKRFAAVVLTLTLTLAAGCTQQRDLIESRPLYHETHPSTAAEEVLQTNPLAAADAEQLAIYRAMFDFIYASDSGMNNGVALIALDTRELQNLSDPVRDALWTELAAAYDCEVIAGDMESLRTQGRLTAQGDGAYFADGMLITLREQPRDGDRVRFSADKWRGPRGAAYLSDCLLERTADGWTVTEPGSLGLA